MSNSGVVCLVLSKICVHNRMYTMYVQVDLPNGQAKLFSIK